MKTNQPNPLTDIWINGVVSFGTYVKTSFVVCDESETAVFHKKNAGNVVISFEKAPRKYDILAVRTAFSMSDENCVKMFKLLGNTGHDLGIDDAI